ncbi:MAG: hypothetical protein COU08_02525, partial [Candidatus Harrisonbacteria bacterium CG10_big_fil_rev_8_21_14_0_10_42_17]
YFFLVTAVFRTHREWRLLFNVFLGVGVVIGVYAVLQRFGILRAIQGGQLRVDGTLGNPTYLAGYSLFMIGIAILLFFESRKMWLKYLYGASTLFGVLILYLTASRGPILGLLAGLGIIPLLYVCFGGRQGEDKKYKKIAGIALIILIILPIGFWLIKDTSLIQSNTTLSRLANISLTDKTTQSRFIVWFDIAWEGIKERPILGWGQENFIAVFSSHYDPRMIDQEPWFDRAHNIIFDWLINAGILGLLAYLGLFAAAFIMFWGGYKNKKITFAQAGIFVAVLIAYFVQNLVVFDNYMTYLMSFTVLAYASNTEAFGDEDEKKQEYPIKKVNQSMIIAGISTVLMMVLINAANIKPLKQSQTIIRAMASVGSGSVAEVQENFENALAYDTFGNYETREQMGRLAVDLVGVQNIPVDQKLSFIGALADITEEQLKSYPHDLRTQLFLSTLYNRAAQLDPTYRERAKQHIDIATMISPTRQAVYFTLADYYLLINDFDNALKAVQKGVDLAPEFSQVQSNLAIISIYAGNKEVEEKAVNDLLAIEPNKAIEIARVGNAYIQTQQFDKALVLYEAAVKHDEGSAENHLTYATLLFNNGQKERAIEVAKEAARIAPIFQNEVDAFLTQIEEGGF